MPELQTLWERRGPDGFGIVGAIAQEEIESVPAFVSGVRVTYPIVMIAPAIEVLWGGIGLVPTSFLVGENGRVLRRYSGFTPEQLQGVVEDVEAVLAGKRLKTRVSSATPVPPRG